MEEPGQPPSPFFLTWGPWASCPLPGPGEGMTELTFHLPSQKGFSGYPKNEEPGNQAEGMGLSERTECEHRGREMLGRECLGPATQSRGPEVSGPPCSALKWGRRGSTTSTLERAGEQTFPDIAPWTLGSRNTWPQVRFLGTQSVCCRSLLFVLVGPANSSRSEQRWLLLSRGTWPLYFRGFPCSSQDLLMFLVRGPRGLAGTWPWVALEGGWGGEKREQEGLAEADGTGALSRLELCLVVASRVKMSGKRLKALTEGPVFPLPVSHGVASSSEELRWRH